VANEIPLKGQTCILYCLIKRAWGIRIIAQAEKKKNLLPLCVKMGWIYSAACTTSIVSADNFFCPGPY